MERKPRPTGERDSQEEPRSPPTRDWKSRWGQWLYSPVRWLLVLIRKALRKVRRRFLGGFQGTTSYDWVMLVGVWLVPLVLFFGGIWFNAKQNARQNLLEQQRAKTERKIEEQRAQEAALQTYLDQMSQLLLEENLRNAEKNSEVRTLARARTLTVGQAPK